MRATNAAAAVSRKDTFIFKQSGSQNRETITVYESNERGDRLKRITKLSVARHKYRKAESESFASFIANTTSKRSKALMIATKYWLDKTGPFGSYWVVFQQAKESDAHGSKDNYAVTFIAKSEHSICATVALDSNFGLVNYLKGH